MRTPSIVDHIFGRFQNLNLLFLIADLRHGLTTRGDWSDSRGLCPVAHGLANGESVRLLDYASQAVAANSACYVAARQLRVAPYLIEKFVELWDSAWLDSNWLLDQLEAILAERLGDADAVQALLISNESFDPAELAWPTR